MTTPYDSSAAIAVLPPVREGRLENETLRKWLSQADLELLAEPATSLGGILRSLSLPVPDTGLGALRMWGQTGERPTVWIAAADPVYLEPRLDHLVLHALDRKSVPVADLRPLIDHLQARLASDDRFGFARLGTYGYLRAASPIATPLVPAAEINRQEPGEFLPSGPSADSYRALVSEVEMALHEHAVNQRRAEQGLPPVNAFWFWGGGPAPQQRTVPHPPLFADDPLLTGHWLSNTAVALKWPGNIAGCVDAALAGFVAVAPQDDDPALLESWLAELREVLLSGRISALSLRFQDGVGAWIEPRHRWRAWRRRSPMLD